MLARATTHALVGLDARPVEVEAHLQRGVPAFSIVGLPDKACQEAKERVRSGITSALEGAPAAHGQSHGWVEERRVGFPPNRAAVLAASHQIPAERLAQHAALGELALDGRVRPVPGALVAAEAAAGRLDRLICPRESAPEAALAGIEPIPVEHLAQAGAYLRGTFEPRAVVPPEGQRSGRSRPRRCARPGARARRALELAAAAKTISCLRARPARGRRCSPGLPRASSCC